LVGLAFVEYESEDSCAGAISKLNERDFDGRAMRVNLSGSKSDGNIFAKYGEKIPCFLYL